MANLHGKSIAFITANEGVEQVELTEPMKAVLEPEGACEIVAPQPGEVQDFNDLDKADRFEGSAPPTANAREAFLRGRVSDDLKPSGYVGVYLDNGTQLIVDSRDLLRFNPAVEQNSAPPDSCSADD